MTRGLVRVLIGATTAFLAGVTGIAAQPALLSDETAASSVQVTEENGVKIQRTVNRAFVGFFPNLIRTEVDVTTRSDSEGRQAKVRASSWGS